jgi:hypothetical protein
MRWFPLTFAFIICGRILGQLPSDSGDELNRKSVQAERRAAKLLLELPGYDQFKKDFIFEEPPFTGGVNAFPESIFARMHTSSARLVDSVWWWDPLDASGRPKVNFDQFRSAYDDASRYLTRYSWLQDWKSAQAGRSVELWLFGTQIGIQDFEISFLYIPLWKDAGFTGGPSYSVLLRRPDDSWIHVLFGRDESRAVMNDSFVRPKDGKTPHWLDTFDLAFHPNGKRSEKYSKYLVISPSGEHELRTYSKAKPGAPKRTFRPSYTGGDGSSLEKAVIVKAPDEQSGVDAEHAYMHKHFPQYRFRSQSLFLRERKSYDVLKFIGPDGRERTFYFDVTSFLGKS